MAYSSKAVFLPDAAELVAESLGQESSREAESQMPPRLRYGRLLREARYELIRALRDGAIEAEAEHIIAPNDGFPCVEIRKVSRVWWTQAVVEPPRHINLWKPGHIYVMWSGDGILVIGPGCSPPRAGYVIDGATGVRGISLELETLLAIWPVAELSRERTKSRPGPKGSGRSIKTLVCEIADEILADDARRPALGYGRLTALALLVNAELALRGHQYQDESIRKMIQPFLREWEGHHPGS